MDSNQTETATNSTAWNLDSETTTASEVWEYESDTDHWLEADDERSATYKAQNNKGATGRIRSRVRTITDVSTVWSVKG